MGTVFLGRREFEEGWKQKCEEHYVMIRKLVPNRCPTVNFQLQMSRRLLGTG